MLCKRLTEFGNKIVYNHLFKLDIQLVCFVLSQYVQYVVRLVVTEMTWSVIDNVSTSSFTGCVVTA